MASKCCAIACVDTRSAKGNGYAVLQYVGFKMLAEPRIGYFFFSFGTVFLIGAKSAIVAHFGCKGFTFSCCFFLQLASLVDN